MTNMFNQEVFDKVAVHLLTQGTRSVSGVNQCYYRGVNGLKCAIGCLIEDADYEPIMDTKRIGVHGLVDELQFQNNPSIQKLKASDINFLSDLQKIHDMRYPYTWYKYLVAFAEFSNLNTDAIQRWNI